MAFNSRELGTETTQFRQLGNFLWLVAFSVSPQPRGKISARRTFVKRLPQLLLLLFQPLFLSPDSMFPVCLPPAVPRTATVTDYAGETSFVAGWGCFDEDDCRPEDNQLMLLRDTAMPVVDNELAMCW